MTAELHVAEKALDLVGDGVEAEVAVIRARQGLTRFANSAIHQHVEEDVTKVALRVAAGGRVAAEETTRVGDRGLRALVERVREAVALAPLDPGWPGLAPPATPPSVVHDDPATHAPDPALRAEQVRAFCAAGGELLGAGYVDSSGVVRAFANSAGQSLTGTSSRASLDAIHQTPTSAGRAHQTSVRVGDIDGAAAGAAAAGLARDSAETVDVDPGRYEIVLSPECVALMVQYLAYYGFNAKAHLEGQSFVVVGEQQFDTAFSLWDDATDARALGVPFDAEGTPKGRLDLVRAGATAGLAHDRRTARRAGAGVESTGHAVPGGERTGPVPTQMFVETGAATVDGMVAAMRRGLVVTEFNYVRILDPKTMVNTGLTRNGTFLVQEGEVVGAVSNLRFTQSFSEALAPGRILGVGRDARLLAGAVTAPALHLAEWNFTGGTRG